MLRGHAYAVNKVSDGVPEMALVEQIPLFQFLLICNFTRNRPGVEWQRAKNVISERTDTRDICLIGDSSRDPLYKIHMINTKK